MELQLKNNFDVMIPVAPKDVPSFIRNISHLQRRFPTSQIVIISNKTVANRFADLNINFIDEDALIEGLNFDRIYEYLKKYNAESRTGWYFQQFIKMAYALICENEYYLSWDADTIPLRKIELFDEEGKPSFSIKEEYHAPYFKTIENLFGYPKSIQGSFVAEHMMFKSEIMREIIDKISRYNPHKKWYENILDSIDKEDIKFAGFSEFETYGTYVLNCYPDTYTKRKITAFRNGSLYFADVPTDEVLKWIGKKYETMSFEQSQKQKFDIRIFELNWFRKICSFDMYRILCKLLSINVSSK